MASLHSRFFLSLHRISSHSHVVFNVGRLLNSITDLIIGKNTLRNVKVKSDMKNNGEKAKCLPFCRFNVHISTKAKRHFSSSPEHRYWNVAYTKQCTVLVSVYFYCTVFSYLWPRFRCGICVLHSSRNVTFIYLFFFAPCKHDKCINIKNV